jgi:hypothetical protein
MAEGLMIQPFVIVGSLAFWGLAALFFLISVIALSSGRTGRAYASVLGFAIFLVALTDANLVNWLKTNWLVTLEYTGAYLAIGAIYMVFRWRMLSANVARIYQTIRDEFLKARDIQEITTDREKADLREQTYLNAELRKLDAGVPLLVRENKARNTNWMVLWPFSMVEYVVGDLLVNIVDGILQGLSGFMQNITNRHFAKFSELN